MSFTAQLKRPDGEWEVDPEADFEVGIEAPYGPTPMLATLRQCLAKAREVIDQLKHPEIT